MSKKLQRILPYIGRFINDWLEEKNQEGWYAKQIIQRRYDDDISMHDCLVLLEKEIKDEKEN